MRLVYSLGITDRRQQRLRVDELWAQPLLQAMQTASAHPSVQLRPASWGFTTWRMVGDVAAQAARKLSQHSTLPLADCDLTT